MVPEVLVGCSTSNTLSAAGVESLNKVLARRAKTARQILCDEIKMGQKTSDDIPQEEVAAIVFRYMRASQEGAARMNLRLMAAIISEQIKTTDLYADDFLRWASIICDLKRDEIIVLGVMQNIAFNPHFTSKNNENYWKNCLKILEENHDMTEQDVYTIASACLRTGLIRETNRTWLNPVYGATNNLKNLYDLINIEGVLKRDAKPS